MEVHIIFFYQPVGNCAPLAYFCGDIDLIKSRLIIRQWQTQAESCSVAFNIYTVGAGSIIYNI